MMGSQSGSSLLAIGNTLPINKSFIIHLFMGTGSTWEQSFSRINTFLIVLCGKDSTLVQYKYMV